MTPNSDLIKLTRQSISIDLHVIIRPREGDFTASEEELNQMLQSIQECKTIGVDGIVVGVLKTNGTLDVKSMNLLVEAAKPMSVTFHRAFDVCTNPLSVFEQLQSLDIQRLLTSGQAKKAIEGVPLIKQLISSKQKVSVMAGSGVNAENIPALWNAGVRQFHFTSHTQKIGGKNEFDREKTLAAKTVLEALCDT